ncbi:MAG: FG-GAP-like repeat-containing protein [Planctomycetota bacterium]|nr:FG-GAP-like repeat-containing protein [Planctomycetota bacterium]
MRQIRERATIPALSIFALLGTFICADLCGQTLPATYVDEAVLRGLDFQYLNASPGHGQGFAAVDLDQDGDADLVLTGVAEQVQFLENDGNGYFTNRTDVVNPPTISNAGAIAAGDPDGDGDLDILILSWTDNNYLLRNDGDFQFLDISQHVGLDLPGHSVGGAFGDLNGDEWVDLLIVTGNAGSSLSRDHIYFNDGQGNFLPPTDITGIFLEEPGMQGMLQDFDLDGDLDIYISNDKGYTSDFPNRMFENQEGLFIERSDQGSGVVIDSMGVCAGDINLDGKMDLYCTNYVESHPLLQNDGDFSFSDVTATYGVGFGIVSWGALFFDHQLDGDLDLLVVDSNAPNRLFVQDGPQPWIDNAPSLGLDTPGFSYCCIQADFDLDGDIDLLTQDHLGNLHLFMHPDDDSGNFIRLDPVAPAPNHFAIGSRVEMFDDAGTLLWAVQRGAGQYYKSEGEWILHHGLADAESVAELTVTFPGGATRTLTDLPANNTWKLFHPDLLGDGDRDRDIDFNDYLQFLVAADEGFQAGFEIFDMNGDSSIDVVDLEALLDRYGGPLLDCDNDGVLDLMELFLGTATDQDEDWLPDNCDLNFIRGDVNIDLAIDIADPIQLLAHLFFGDPCSCIAAIDSNHDNQVNIADPVFLLGYLFSTSAAPEAPFPDCGEAQDIYSCLSSGCP